MFIATLFTNANSLSAHGEMTKWMDLEGIMLREMVRERLMLYDLSYMWNLNKNKQTNKLRKEIRFVVVTRGRGWVKEWWMNKMKVIKRYKFLVTR